MEELLIEELFVQTFKDLEERIEIVVSDIISAMIKGLFVSAVMSRANLQNGYLKILLFGIFHFQKNRRTLHALKLIFIGCLCIYLSLKLKQTVIAYSVITLLFLHSQYTDVMDTLVVELLIWYILRFELMIHDAIIIHGIMGTIVGRMLFDKQKSMIDLLLGMTLFLILAHLHGQMNELSLFDIFILSNAWLLMKS